MFFACLVVILPVLYIYLRTLFRPTNFPPGPAWTPIVGNLFHLRNLSKKLGGQHHALAKLANEYKTNVLGLKLGQDYVIAVFSYDVVREVLTKEEYDGRPDNYFIRLRCLGTRKGITCTEGEPWRIQRSFITTHFRRLGYGKTPMENFIKEEITEIFQILNKEEEVVKIGSILAPAVINILWALTSGRRIKRSEKRLEELLLLLDKRAKAFDMAGGTLSQLPFLRFLAPELIGFNLIQDINMKLKSLLQEAIDQHMAEWSEDKRNDDLIYAFIAEMKSIERNESIFTEDQLIMVCLDIFIAGSQTTSNTLDFAFLMMILHPNIQSKVQKCLDLAFEDVDYVSYAAKSSVPYVEAVLLEVERYCHVAPICGPRRVLKDTILEGYSIPKNTTVLISLHSVHHDIDYWKDPAVFRPERFLNDDGELLLQDRMLPFGLGRRRCLGDVLAKNCIFIFFVEIMRKFDVHLSPGSKAPVGVPLPGITLTPEDYCAKFTKRMNC